MKITREQQGALRRDHGICANEALSVYFDLPSGPERGSPLGVLMRRIVAESPEIGFGEARRLASKQLWKAAGRKRYNVTTPRQDKARAERLKAQVNATLETAKTTPIKLHSPALRAEGTPAAAGLKATC
jgi:hypothetical protein